tara:strand:- start:413 stop:610 length:198 start_codon:yes stop_codon:yes gene_type:complete
MAYNIIKIMRDHKTGQKTHVLLTDGLSEIWDIKKKEEALRIVTMLTENSDSGHKYEIRGTCNRSK